MKTFKYLQCGTIVEQAVESIPTVEVAVSLGAELAMPEKATVFFNDRSSAQMDVIWNEEELAVIDTSVSGEYEVSGTFADIGTEVDGKELTSTTQELLKEEGFLRKLLRAVICKNIHLCIAARITAL